ncbi:MAG: sulfatase-like hydrolase/transferase [Candidatus Brocadiia bacterium]
MADDTPNILLLFTDQQRYDTIAAAGFDHMITPNLDRLVREGCLFRRAYTANPICIPARHNLITGLPARFHGYSSNMGHPLDHRLPVLPRILSDAGWETRAVGKMHFRPVRRHNGFDRMELMEEIPRWREHDDYAMYLKEVGLGQIVNIHGVRNLLYLAPQRSLIPEEHHGSAWVGDRSVEFLRANAGRRPFFLWSSWIHPHPPWDVPDSLADLYAGRDIPEPLVSETPTHPGRRGGWSVADIPPGREDYRIRRARELYYAAITLVDKNIGRILDALEDIGELDNTLVIFTSDHGEMLGDHRSFLKGAPYDSSSRIPMVMRFPERLECGSVREELVDLNDILPTVLDVAGLEYPGEHALPGASVFGGEKDRSRQYIENGRRAGRWVSLLDERYKYSYYFGGGREELFDLQADPDETVNLLHAWGEEPRVAEARGRLRAELVEYEREWGLPGHVVDGDFAVFEEPERNPGRNGQFQRFPEQIADPAERAAMNDFGEEVLAAVREEDVRLHEMDLETWLENGAPQELVERIRREGL